MQYYLVLVTAVELFTALRGRLYDSNKNLVMATLSVIGGLATAMGLSVEKSSKVWNKPNCYLYTLPMAFLLKNQSMKQ
jgi:hypothetical protein